jgi:hypothetical protein
MHPNQRRTGEARARKIGAVARAGQSPASGKPQLDPRLSAGSLWRRRVIDSRVGCARSLRGRGEPPDQENGGPDENRNGEGRIDAVRRSGRSGSSQFPPYRPIDWPRLRPHANMPQFARRLVSATIQTASFASWILVTNERSNRPTDWLIDPDQCDRPEHGSYCTNFLRRNELGHLRPIQTAVARASP